MINCGKFQLDKARAQEVVDLVLKRNMRGEYPFNQENLYPDAVVPSGIDPALYLLHGCSIDQSRPAEQVYMGMEKIALEVPDFNFHELDPDDLRKIIRKHLGGSSFVNYFRTLRDNAKRLAEKYGGDPRKIRAPRKLGDKTVDQTIKNISKFYLYQLPKAALLMKNYVRQGIWRFRQSELYVKVDVHLARISIGTGILQTQERVLRSDPIIRHLSRLYREITMEQGISALLLDDLMWAWGSKLCALTNQTSKTYCCDRFECELNCGVRPVTRVRNSYYHVTKDMRKPGTKDLFQFLRPGTL